jgi:predicted ATP-dependent endonuclease of OLD family
VPEGRLFLIDEPQAYLHPHAERTFLAFLEDHPQHQYVIATNSGYLLNARPISQARLLTIHEGATRITELGSRDQLLTELEITAADLWLAESVLWVEGPSEVAAFDVLSRAEPANVSSGLTVKKMPGAASRFASRRRAAETFRFCHEITDAVSPLPIRMLFLFDTDEKTDEAKGRILEASRGLAEFLPVRELENLFLQADVLHAAITARCGELELDEPSESAVADELQDQLARMDDDELYPLGLEDGADPLERVKASKLIGRLFWKFARSDYDKAEDARLLTEVTLRMKPSALDPLRLVLSRLRESSESS